MATKGSLVTRGAGALLLALFSTLAPSATTTITSLPTPATAAPSSHFGNTLWVGETAGVLKIATADGTILFQIPDVGDVRAVAVDDRQGTVWAVANGTLSAYGPDGDKQLGIALPAGNPGQAHLALAVDAASSGVWVAQQKELYQLTQTGQITATVRLDSPIRALALDSTHRELWVATVQTLRAYDAAAPPCARLHCLTPPRLPRSPTMPRSTHYGRPTRTDFTATAAPAPCNTS